MRRLRWFGVVEGRLLWTGTKGAGGTRKVPRSCHKRSTTTTAWDLGWVPAFHYVISYFRTDPLGNLLILASNLLILAIGRF